MHRLKTLVLATASVGIFALTPLAASAAETDVSQQLSEARQEGSIWTAMALNRHLNPFKIDNDVENGTATLTGTVESSVERDLAEQVALSIEGINKVDNQLKIDSEVKAGGKDSQALASRLDDAGITATVKSKLLWNTNTEGLDISVKTEEGAVTLTGNAQTPAAKELAGRLAANTEGVREVFNHLSISQADSTATQAQNAANDASAAISDAWITSKVKSSFVYTRNLDAFAIQVETNDGFVKLSGTVLSSAAKSLAVETARDIRGVRGVDADALRIES
ncbi:MULTISPECIES: BON domain-containing protein [Pseudomonas]|uniref:Osmotically-inducible protein OsmY, contains BON domain n=1 Tax=Pseudomonas segetis TaxID=298908 RepID=A0A239FEY8_9PSED|nr:MULTISPECIES: BON domain-containing protein [Pseudomonas]SNS55078.1 Osmotically-inducible protein OsmY, contains BON domain [Pseudomonas segetis]